MKLIKEVLICVWVARLTNNIITVLSKSIKKILMEKYLVFDIIPPKENDNINKARLH